MRLPRKMKKKYKLLYLHENNFRVKTKYVRITDINKTGCYINYICK